MKNNLNFNCFLQVKPRTEPLLFAGYELKLKLNGKKCRYQYQLALCVWGGGSEKKV